MSARHNIINKMNEKQCVDAVFNDHFQCVPLCTMTLTERILKKESQGPERSACHVYIRNAPNDL